MNILAALGPILNTAYILFCFALGIWAGIIAIQGKELGGQFWGAMWTCTLMAGVGLLVWLGRVVTGDSLTRAPLYLLYQLYFIIVLPGTFALLRGRDDRVAAAIFAGVAIFSGLAAISAADPSRCIITSCPPTSTGLLLGMFAL